jgi:hypothetical protein
MLSKPDFRWSYSRINSFPEDTKDGCKLCWKNDYIDRKRHLSEGNAFSEYGSWYHKTIEKYLKGEYLWFELQDQFDSFVETSKYDFPPNKYVSLKEKAINGITTHLDDLSWLDDYEILTVEEERKYDLEGIPFISIADLEVRHKTSGEIGILDHKISNIFKKADLSKKLKQLYIYSYSFEKKHGKYPDFLGFNHYKANEVTKFKFDKKEYDKVIKWLIDKVEFIKQQTEFSARCEIVDNPKWDWYASQLCGYRNICEFRKGL